MSIDFSLITDEKISIKINHLSYLVTLTPDLRSVLKMIDNFKIIRPTTEVFLQFDRIIFEQKISLGTFSNLLLPTSLGEIWVLCITLCYK